MKALQEIGDLNIAFYYAGKVIGCRRVLFVPKEVEPNEVPKILNILKSKFHNKFLFDNRYADLGYWEGEEEKKKRSADELTFWYDRPEDVQYLRIQKKGQMAYVDDVEDVFYGDRSVEFLSSVAGCEVYVKKPELDHPFNFLTGILVGNTAGVDVFRKEGGKVKRNPALAQKIADEMDGCYIAKTAKVLYNDEDKAEWTKEKGFPMPTDPWASHFGMIYETKEDNVLMSDATLFCLQDDVTAENIARTIRLMHVRELAGWEIEIKGF